MQRLTTIWNPTLRGYSLRSRTHYTREWFWRSLAHILPRQLAYWSFIDTGVRHMRGDEVVPEVRYTDLLERAAK